MKNISFEYLEHGKFFRNNRTPSDFYDLSYTAGISRYSRDLRDAVRLDPKTSFSEKSGNFSVAFVPVLGKSYYAFVQFQSRYENEFGGSTANRPFFQTRFYLLKTTSWRSLYEQGLSVLPSLLNQNDSTAINTLNTFSEVVGSIGQSLTLELNESNPQNDVFFQYRRDPKNEYLKWVAAIANAVLDYKNNGGVNIQYESSLMEKLKLMDAVTRILLSVNKEPISFGFDPACSARVDVRFGDSIKARGTAHLLDYTGQIWKKANYPTSKLVEIFTSGTGNWQKYHTQVYTEYDIVIKLRNAGNEKDALLFLTCLYNKEYAKLFLNATSKYDDYIVPLMSEKDLSIVIEEGNEESRSRLLLNNLILQKLSIGNWFDYLQISPWSSTRLRNLLSRYFEINLDNKEEIISYFGKIVKDRLIFFQIEESRNLLYDLIKKYFRQGISILEEKPADNEELSPSNILNLTTLISLKDILNGIKKLPIVYDQQEEMWSWVGLYIKRFFIPKDSLINCFERLDLSASDYPYLFIKALSELHISYQGINKQDKSMIDRHAKMGIVEFIEIKKGQSKKTKQISKSKDGSMSTTAPGFINVLDQANQEKNDRTQKPKIEGDAEKKTVIGVDQENSDYVNRWTLIVLSFLFVILMIFALWLSDWLIRFR